MENSFVSLAELLKQKREEMLEVKFKSQRAELFNELYSFYERSYKTNSWSSYISWLKQNKFKHSQEKVKEYKESKSFRKKISVKSFCSHWFGFIKTRDLYYLISICKDKENRRENVNKWLFWSIKADKC